MTPEQVIELFSKLDLSQEQLTLLVGSIDSIVTVLDSIYRIVRFYVLFRLMFLIYNAVGVYRKGD